jgi:copper chaperone CopZ
MNKLLFKIQMSCEGCENTIKRLLLKKNNNLKIETDIKNQMVKIEGDIEINNVYEILEKWSKASNKEIKFISTY